MQRFVQQPMSRGTEKDYDSFNFWAMGQRPMQPVYQLEEETESESETEDSEAITLQYIITNKPPIKEVREFFRENLAGIKSDEAKLFEK